MSNILLILYPTQLFEQKYIDKIFNHTESCKKSAHVNSHINSHIILYEHPYFFTKYPYHKMKLILHRASMKNYFDSLDKKKYHLEYVQCGELNKINSYIKSKSIDQIRFFNPIEKELVDMILNNKIYPNTIKLIFPSPYFLNSSKTNTNQVILGELGGLRHDLFYKSQRIKYNIMVTKSGDKYIPDGSSWSFDKENRKPFEPTQTEPNILDLKSGSRIKYLKEAQGYVEKNFSQHYGLANLDNFIYPINRTEAIKWLKYFISHKLDNFGKYEDALSSKIKFGFHSILSPLTNIGLITPYDIIEHVNGYKKNIASKEGFLRQVIGWREYCYFTYDLFKKELELNNLYNKSKYPIPKYVWESHTQIPPIDNILTNLSSNGYSHHIERLMGIGNFLILIETNPKEIYNWFQTMYIDAYDVFMIPNVYGMLCYGNLTEKSHMMTRPYFASSNYLMKMSDYKSNCCVKIANTEYKWDEIMDCLYWSHVNKYSNEFKKIYATASAVSRFNKFDSDKKTHILKIANLYKKWIHI
jgi:deoxyribodipyrimidine photolyase-related protein